MSSYRPLVSCTREETAVNAFHRETTIQPKAVYHRVIALNFSASVSLLCRSRNMILCEIWTRYFRVSFWTKGTLSALPFSRFSYLHVAGFASAISFTFMIRKLLWIKLLNSPSCFTLSFILKTRFDTLWEDLSRKCFFHNICYIFLLFRY